MSNTPQLTSSGNSSPLWTTHSVIMKAAYPWFSVCNLYLSCKPEHIFQYISFFHAQFLFTARNIQVWLTYAKSQMWMGDSLSKTSWAPKDLFFAFLSLCFFSPPHPFISKAMRKTVVVEEKMIVLGTSCGQKMSALSQIRLYCCA